MKLQTKKTEYQKNTSVIIQISEFLSTSCFMILCICVLAFSVLNIYNLMLSQNGIILYLFNLLFLIAGIYGSYLVSIITYQKYFYKLGEKCNHKVEEK